MTQRPRGFTLVELLVVMAILATLLSVALPRYFGALQQSREAALRHSLLVVRESIDKFYADHGQYPVDLEDLQRKRYLRNVPVDPLTDSASTWVLVPPPAASGLRGALYDLKSGSAAVGLDGTAVSTW